MNKKLTTIIAVIALALVFGVIAFIRWDSSVAPYQGLWAAESGEYFIAIDGHEADIAAVFTDEPSSETARIIGASRLHHRLRLQEGSTTIDLNFKLTGKNTAIIGKAAFTRPTD